MNNRKHNVKRRLKKTIGSIKLIFTPDLTKQNNKIRHINTSIITTFIIQAKLFEY